MFMIPIPPTSRLMLPIAASRTVNVEADDVAARQEVLLGLDGEVGLRRVADVMGPQEDLGGLELRVAHRCPGSWR